MLWIKERVYTALGLHDDNLFADLLSRDQNNTSQELVSCLDKKLDGYSPAMLFYPFEHEVEDMIEVVEGNLVNLLLAEILSL